MLTAGEKEETAEVSGYSHLKPSEQRNKEWEDCREKVRNLAEESSLDRRDHPCGEESVLVGLSVVYARLMEHGRHRQTFQ